MYNVALARKGEKNGMFGSARFGKMNPFFGRKHSEQTKAKIRAKKVGIKLSLETREKIKKSCKGINKGIKSVRWKGDSVGYVGLHSWVRRSLGKPNSCTNCGVVRNNPNELHWANLSGNYERSLSDWIRLCVSCHRTYDSFKRQGLIKSIV